jgi:S1-C subfamily serine protease
MTLVLLLLALPNEIDVVESRDFSRETQAAAVTGTVRVVNVGQEMEGSGAVLKRNGPFVYVLTAAHVVADARRVDVATFTADSYPRAAALYRGAEVVARSAAADLAVLRVTTRDALPGSLRVCPPTSVPDAKDFPALAVGCAEGGPPTCTVETVRGKRRVRKPGAEETACYWQAEGEPARGRSGGPLLDRRGYLIGVASGAGDGKGYYGHAEELHAFLRRNGLKWLYEETEK